VRAAKFSEDRPEEAMKYLGLGYLDEKKWDAMTKSEQEAMLEECLSYDDVLRKNGQMLGGEALQGARNAATLRFQSGKVSITDGPYAETKEQLGGIWMLEADDLNHAIQLMSQHPAVQWGPIEIRPAAEDINAMIAERSRAARP
jgi:hypothetical protein